MQHWIYTAVYLDVCLVARSYLSSSKTIESLETRQTREKCLSSFNAALYVIFITAFLVDFFLGTDAISVSAGAVLSAVMTGLLTWSFRKMSKLLSMLQSRGIKVRRKTILVQLVLLGFISVLDIVYVSSKIRFWKDCTDDKIDESWAGVVTRVFSMTVMLMWRFVALTMCVFYLGHAKTYSQHDITAIEYDFQRAICIEDDEPLSDLSDYDDEDESTSSDSELAITRVKRNNNVLNSKRQEARKRELLMALLSISKGDFNSRQVETSMSSRSTVSSKFLQLIHTPPRTRPSS